LIEAGVKVVGPSRAAAQIESNHPKFFPRIL